MSLVTVCIISHCLSLFHVHMSHVPQDHVTFTETQFCAPILVFTSVDGWDAEQNPLNVQKIKVFGGSSPEWGSSLGSSTFPYDGNIKDVWPKSYYKDAAGRYNLHPLKNTEISVEDLQVHPIFRSSSLTKIPRCHGGETEAPKHSGSEKEIKFTVYTWVKEVWESEKREGENGMRAAGWEGERGGCCADGSSKINADRIGIEIT